MQDIAAPVQLLVEGKDQVNVFKTLAEDLGLDDVQVQDFGGVSELREFLSFFALAPGIETVRSVGIVRDAERNAAGAFQSVQDSLRAFGMPVPNEPGEHTAGEPAVSVLILPGGGREGMLETLLCETFAGTAEEACIDDFFACLAELPGVSIERPDKARAQAWLAMKPQPQVSVGVAAQKDYWDLEHAALEPVREFLRAL